jgi:hypothetical protein
MSQRDWDLAEDYQREALRMAELERFAEQAKQGQRGTRSSKRPRRSRGFRWGIWLLLVAAALLVGAVAWGLSLLPELDAIGVVRDVLVLIYLFVLRLGVPLIVTLMFGSFLQHWLQQQDAKEAIARRQFETTAPCCWETKNCPESVRENCVAYQRPELPCWLALQVAGYGLKEQCYACALYTTRRVTVPA